MVRLSEDDQGLAAGQFAAFYREDLCLGSGIILDSWDETSFPICSRALEIARLEDKSSLGKPVRIINLEHIVKPEQEAIKVAWRNPADVTFSLLHQGSCKAIYTGSFASPVKVSIQERGNPGCSRNYRCVASKRGTPGLSWKDDSDMLLGSLRFRREKLCFRIEPAFWRPWLLVHARMKGWLVDLI